MYKEKNYNIWYKLSMLFLIVAVLIHITGYFTNILYIAAWILWMPVIALAVITVFDIKNTDKRERAIIFSKESMKSITFLILIIAFIYVIFNLIYGLTLLNSVWDIRAADGVYYAVDENNNMTEIGYNDYVKYSLASFRMLSGHMLVFIAAPLWYYGEKKKLSKN
ncbi:MAG: hypothetical protein ACLRVQ_08530 [Lachnospiraceae bacterium]